ncbi:MAG: cyclophilin-like fold protein, partial [Lachnospiraceae bacterium]|nr:cyclophilin-like fold protein [Lachnospiraceae bacterium]
MKFTVTANGTEFSVIPEKNAAVSELQSRLKDGDLKLTLQDYSGFEKVGALGFSLPRSNVQMTTKAGDIVLYNGNQI